MESSLVSCDAYSLESILSYVPGGSILQLVVCGSPKLSAKVFSSCRTLCLSWDGFGRSRWPSLIQHFSQLTDFRYGNAEDIRYLPCVDVKIEHLPRSLRRLTLSYFDPVSSLFTASLLPNNTLHYTSPDYATHLPYLETLSIYSKVALEPSAFGLFPASLTHLEIHCKDRFDGVAVLPHLSRTLKHLAIGTMTTCDDEERWKHFPPQLESLELYFVEQSPCWVQHLPSSLKSLKIEVSSETEGEYMRIWPLLPRGLLTLCFEGSPEHFDLELYRQLPSSLETLIWPTNMSPRSEDDDNSVLFDDMISNDYDACVESLFSHRPASLTSLDFGGLQFCSKTLQACPWRCKNATIQNARDLSELSLPALSSGIFASLFDLGISKGSLTVEVAELLPTTIEILSVESISNSVAIALGKRLVSLSFLYCIGGSLSSSGVSGLPQSLDSMSLGHAVLEDLECLKELPKRLKSLFFFTQDEETTNGHLRHSAIEQDEASALMPETLTRLSMYTPRRLPEVWFKGLAQHPSLTELNVSYETRLSSNVFSYMPKQIRTITMAIEDLDGKSLKSLPSSVRHLQLGGWGKSRLTDKDLTLIPENIYSITAAASELVTEEAEQFLPKNVFTFQLGWGITRSAHDFDQYPQARSNIT